MNNMKHQEYLEINDYSDNEESQYQIKKLNKILSMKIESDFDGDHQESYQHIKKWALTAADDILSKSQLQFDLGDHSKEKLALYIRIYYLNGLFEKKEKLSNEYTTLPAVFVKSLLNYGDKYSVENLKKILL